MDTWNADFSGHSLLKDSCTLHDTPNGRVYDLMVDNRWFAGERSVYRVADYLQTEVGLSSEDTQEYIFDLITSPDEIVRHIR